MNETQFQRLIRLSRKTGSPLVILSEDGEESVLLSLDQYETLVSDARPTVKTALVPAAPSSPPPAREARPLPPLPREVTPAPSNLPEAPEESAETETQFYLEPVE